MPFRNKHNAQYLYKIILHIFCIRHEVRPLRYAELFACTDQLIFPIINHIGFSWLSCLWLSVQLLHHREDRRDLCKRHTFNLLNALFAEDRRQFYHLILSTLRTIQHLADSCKLIDVNFFPNHSYFIVVNFVFLLKGNIFVSVFLFLFVFQTCSLHKQGAFFYHLLEYPNVYSPLFSNKSATAYLAASIVWLNSSIGTFSKLSFLSFAHI